MGVGREGRYSMTRRFLLGSIGAAHSMHGEVVLQSFTKDPKDIAAYGPLTDETGRRTMEIISIRVAGKGIIARLKGVNDRTAAEGLRGTALYVDRDKMPVPKPEDFYHADLVGLKAIAPDGKVIGEVIDVPNYGGGDLIEIRPDAGGETILVAFTKDYVPVVDVAGGRLEVIVPVLNEDEPEDGDDSEASG